MKIDENCINEKAIQAIDEVVALPFEFCDGDEGSDHMRLVTIGAIRGVLDLANLLKGALKDDAE